MGVGKTLVAIETMKRLGNPVTVVVCPRSIIPTWCRTAEGQGAGLDAINYEKVRLGKTPYGQWVLPSPRHRKPRFVWNSEIKFLIFDEVHRCKSYDSKNSDLLRAARRQGIPVLALSGTPADSPLELDALGYVLRLHDGNDSPTLRNPEPLSFYSWARRHGCGPGYFSAFDFLGSDEDRLKQMLKINKLIFPHKGVRVRVQDLPDFPECQVTSELYEPGFGPDELEAATAECVGPLDRRLRARQFIEKHKVPIFTELAQDAIAQGKSVAIFVNFTETLQMLCTELKTKCCVDGSQTGTAGAERREANRLDFQADRSRVIIVNNEAGGLGLDLQDLNGNHPRLGLVSAGENAKTLKQVLKRLPRQGAKSKSLYRILFAADTDEEDVHRNLSHKLDRIDALNDGDLAPQKNLQISVTK